MAAGLWAGTVAGLVDGSFALARGGTDSLFLLTAGGLLALVGAIVAIPLHAVARVAAAWWRPLWRQTNRPWAWLVSGLALAMASGVVLFAVSASYLERNTPPHVAFRLTVIAVAISPVVVALTPGLAGLVARFRHGPAALGLAVAAAGLTLAPGLLRVTTLLDLRWCWVMAAFVVAFPLLSFALGRDRPRAARAALAASIVGLALVVGSLVTLQTSAQVRLIAARYAPLSGPVARIAAVGLRRAPAELTSPGASTQRRAATEPSEALPSPPTIPTHTPAEPEPKDRPHFFLLSVDALRADRLGLYGYERPTSPRIDRFFGAGAVFERAYSASPVTERALPAIFGGIYPSMCVEALSGKRHRLSPQRILLAERLTAAKYLTVALLTAFMVREDRLDQGLSKVDLRPLKEGDFGRKPSADYITDLGLEYVDRHQQGARGRPLFLWLHYFEPHEPYTAPDEYRLWDDGGKRPEHATDRYDATILYTDTAIGRFLDGLQERQLLDSSLVVLVGDHGEEFLDHGGYNHDSSVYDEQVRVPLAIRLPGAKPSRILAPVSLVDFMPTVLELLDIPVQQGLAGRSHARAVLGQGPAEARPVFLEQFKRKGEHLETVAVVAGRHKLIRGLDEDLWELYDLEQDPREQHNLVEEDPQTFVRLRAILREHLRTARAAGAVRPDATF